MNERTGETAKQTRFRKMCRSIDLSMMNGIKIAFHYEHALAQSITY